MGIFSTISDALSGNAPKAQPSAAAAPKTDTRSWDTLKAGRDRNECAMGMTPTDGYSCGVERAMGQHADAVHPVTPQLRQ